MHLTDLPGMMNLIFDSRQENLLCRKPLAVTAGHPVQEQEVVQACFCIK